MQENKAKTTTWHLEMCDPAWLRPASIDGPIMDIRRVEELCPELNRSLYIDVGSQWRWVDRLAWTEEQWLAWLDRPEVETWIATIDGITAGYFELELQDHGSVEIAYFGLMPEFIGRGLGGRLLTAAVERAWERGASRVWVHTCSLDSPSALPNYQSRGFRVFKQVTEDGIRASK